MSETRHAPWARWCLNKWDEACTLSRLVPKWVRRSMHPAPSPSHISSFLTRHVAKELKMTRPSQSSPYVVILLWPEAGYTRTTLEVSHPSANKTVVGKASAQWGAKFPGHDLKCPVLLERSCDTLETPTTQRVVATESTFGLSALDRCCFSYGGKEGPPGVGSKPWAPVIHTKTIAGILTIVMQLQVSIMNIIYDYNNAHRFLLEGYMYTFIQYIFLGEQSPG